MYDYDFRTLNDKEFEIFCADLLGEKENYRFERFKPGRDSGVDGRFFKGKNSEVVLQCKHWVNTPIDQLISRLNSVELKKVEKLSPARYLIAISNPLSRNDKSRIANVLSPFLKSESDIFGKEDLNDLLSKYKHIEERHYKLWLCSTNVLSHILNKPIFDRSRFTLEEIQEFSRKYVVTSHHSSALKILERLGTVIITGEPGIGKTTLAEHLCLHSVANGFQFFKIADEIREAEAVFEKDQKQVFYFDDFLGRNYLEALTGHESGHIVQFIKRVAKDSSKRFVLTSRSTILNQGKILMDQFLHQNISRNEHELTISALSELDKAKILYSHIWHSGLTSEYIDEIYKDKRYRKIVAHQNFNPRLISFLTDPIRLTSCLSIDYWRRVESLLNNPAEIWDHPFMVQQDDFGRAIVFLVALNGRPIGEGALAEAYARQLSEPHSSSMHGRKDFQLNLRHLTGSLINRKIEKSGNVLIDVFNPSISDYVLARYSSDHPSLTTGFLSLRSDGSLITLSDLRRNELISGASYTSILERILVVGASKQFYGYEPGYVASTVTALVTFLGSAEDRMPLFQAALSYVQASPIPFHFLSVAKLYAWALDRGLVSNLDCIQFVKAACEHQQSSDELKELANIVSDIGGETEGRDEIAEFLCEAIVQDLADDVSAFIDAADIFLHVDEGDLEAARYRARNLVDERLEQYGLAFDSDAASRILDDYDFSGEAENYWTHDDSRGRYRYRSSPISQVHRGSPVDEIDDLFERD